MIAAARERAHTATAQLLAGQLTGGLARRLDRLLELREPGGITWLEWLRTPAAGSSPAEILTALEELEHLRLLGGERVDLSMLAPGRSADARRRWPPPRCVGDLATAGRSPAPAAAGVRGGPAKIRLKPARAGA
jgi:hypothetical protein